MKNNLVSIIIPTYKSWDLLKKCLSAIDKQTYVGEYEVLVVNNDSDHEYPTEILNHKNIRILQELKPGSYAARNKGIAESKGDILVFTDADCIPDKDWLHNGVQMLTLTKAGIVAGDIQFFFKNPNSPTTAEVYDKLTGFNQRGYSKQGHCATANWFSYKKVIEEFGGFNSGLKSNGDSELSGKISSKYNVLFCESAIIFHPARYSIQSIIIKYRRLIGGTFDRVYKFQSSGFGRYILRFILRRLKFNLNLCLKLRFKDAIKVFYVHCFLFPALIKEYYSIRKTGETERL